MLRRRKFMQHFVSVIVSHSKWLFALTLLVLWLLSCNTPGTSFREPRLLNYEGKITNYTGAAETYQIIFQHGTTFDQFTIGKVSFKTDGSFKLNLEKVAEDNLSHEINGIAYEDECSGLQISPGDWKGISTFGGGLDLFKNNVRVGTLWPSATGDIAFFYMDKDVSMKGSCSSSESYTWTINASFKKGWTATLYAANAEKTILSVTTPTKMELAWSFEPEFQFSNDWLDTTFSNDGLVTTEFSSQSGAQSAAYSVAIDSDNKIVVAGTSYVDSSSDFAVARYNPDGELDTSFGDNGKVTTDFNNEFDEAYSVAIDNTGKIVVAGNIRSNGIGNFGIARYNPAGSLDTSFGDDGKVTTEGGIGRSVTIDSTNKIIVAGWGWSGSDSSDFIIVRYGLDGSLDSSFGDNGLVTTDFEHGSDEGYAVVIDDTGKIIVAGSSYVTRESYADIALARYNPDGSLDTSFSNDGMTTTDLGSDSNAKSIAVDSTGKIVVAGQCNNVVSSRFNTDFAIARYNTNGFLDTSFSIDGLVRTDFTNYIDVSYDIGHAVAIDNSGKIVVAGHSARVAGTDSFAIARYNP